MILPWITETLAPWADGGDVFWGFWNAGSLAKEHNNSGMWWLFLVAHVFKHQACLSLYQL